MKIYKILTLFVIGFATISCDKVQNRHQDTADMPFDKTSPNFLFIVADDMGYSDFTPFGGEINTPNLDALAQEGVRISNFYTAPTCSPARSMLLTGVDNHKNGMGVMGEFLTPFRIKNPTAIFNQGYKGALNDNVLTIAQVLKTKGYNTYISGKWHLGEKEKYLPINKGFDQSFVLLQGSATHFGQPIPVVSEKAEATLVENKHEVHVADDFYSTIGFTDKLLSYLKSDEERPFFAYLAYTAPHDPLQVDTSYSAKYQGAYEQGYDVIRQKRFETLVEMGVFDKLVKPSEKLAPAWDSLTSEEKKRQSRVMEVYAGMIDNMDEQIGRIIDYLKQSGRYNNTMIVFLSDNGSSSVYLEDYLKMVGSDKENTYISETFDQSYENIGNANSAPAVGAGWAQASMSPFRLWKNTTAEGGIRTPTIIKWQGIAPNKVGTIDHQGIGHVMDFAPTIYDIVGVNYAEQYQQKDKSIESLSGTSLLPFLEGKSNNIRDDYLAWELNGEKALRKGNWKILWVTDDPDNPHWELYDLTTDAGETTDLSEQQPEIFADLIGDYKAYVQRNDVI